MELHIGGRSKELIVYAYTKHVLFKLMILWDTMNIRQHLKLFVVCVWRCILIIVFSVHTEHCLKLLLKGIRMWSVLFMDITRIWKLNKYFNIVSPTTQPP